jgi:hypothetical protein
MNPKMNVIKMPYVLEVYTGDDQTSTCAEFIGSDIEPVKIATQDTPGTEDFPFNTHRDFYLISQEGEPKIIILTVRRQQEKYRFGWEVWDLKNDSGNAKITLAEILETLTEKKEK